MIQKTIFNPLFYPLLNNAMMNNPKVGATDKKKSIDETNTMSAISPHNLRS